MISDLPLEGAASADVRTLVIKTWSEEAEKQGLRLAGFDPNAPDYELIAWARAAGLHIATVLSRFSTKMQHSTESQVYECVKYAARHGMFVIPQFVCVDEAAKGRKVNRHALNRVKTILEQQLVDVLLVFKVSRLFRKQYRGFQFIEEECVERGIRAVAVTQGIDTNDKKTWKQLCCLHGLSDEMLLDAISDHVLSGLAELFRNLYVTGALPVGYEAKEVPGGRPTKLGKPRTMPAASAEAAALIRKHFEYHRDGMPIVKGWKLWLQAGGPCDPRSTTRQMSRGAYGRMLRNPRDTGRWAFGRKRNVFSSKLDYTKQEVQPDTDVTVIHSEELRIVSDELFFAVQARLAKTGHRPRGARGRKKQPQLWDMVGEFFVCAECDERHYHYGPGNKSMVCRRRELCPRMTAINRRKAVAAVLDKLCMLIDRDTGLVATIVAKAQELDSRPDESLESRGAMLRGQSAVQANKINDLYELAGTGTEEDRIQVKARIRAAQAQRSALQAELASVERQIAHCHSPVTPEQVWKILGEFRRLLEDAGAGRLGDDVVYRTAQIFKLLVGGRILVCVEPRPGRKRTIVRGRFTPRLLQALAGQLSMGTAAEDEPAEVDVWLRPPPKCDILAHRVHELVDGQGLSYGEAADVLAADGCGRMSAVRISILYGRYYQMINRPRPPHRYNNGRVRKPKKPRS